MHTYDCDPILTDSEVLDFCKKGFIVLDGVMPKEIAVSDGLSGF